MNNSCPKVDSPVSINIASDICALQNGMFYVLPQIESIHTSPSAVTKISAHILQSDFIYTTRVNCGTVLGSRLQVKSRKNLAMASIAIKMMFRVFHRKHDGADVSAKKVSLGMLYSAVHSANQRSFEVKISLPAQNEKLLTLHNPYF